MDEHHGFGIPHAGHQRAMGHAQMRAANLGLVLRYLRDYGGRSRAELAAETGLSKATITNVIAGLAGVGLIEEGASNITDAWGALASKFGSAPTAPAAWASNWHSTIWLSRW